MSGVGGTAVHPPAGNRAAPLSPLPFFSPAGILHEDLRLLLETSMPAKKKKALLGVADAKIGAAILEELGYQCQTGGVVAEILRGESDYGDGMPQRGPYSCWDRAGGESTAIKGHPWWWRGW